MTEGIGEHRLTPPVEQEAATAKESSLAEARRMGSKAILDGIYKGTITDPNALPIYFERYLGEHREAMPQQDPPPPDADDYAGGWSPLIHPHTADDYGRLAVFCYSEVRRREANLEREATFDGTPEREAEVLKLWQRHEKRSDNLKRMAAVFSERAGQLRLMEDETDRATVSAAARQPLPSGPGQQPTARELRALETGDYSHLLDYEVLNGIDEGKITDPRALYVYVQKSLDARRKVARSDNEVKDIEADYAELIFGEPAALARFCLRKAGEWASLDEEGMTPLELARLRRWKSPAHYDIAGRWYSMASRVVLSDTPAVPASGAQPMRREMLQAELAGMSVEDVKRAIEEGTATDTSAIHTYVQKSLDRDRTLHEGDRLREIETAYAELVFADPRDMVRYCLQQADSRLPQGDGLDAVPGDLPAASRWYAMAARFAHEAAVEQRRVQDEDEDE